MTGGILQKRALWAVLGAILSFSSSQNSSNDVIDRGIDADLVTQSGDSSYLSSVFAGASSKDVALEGGC